MYERVLPVKDLVKHRSLFLMGPRQTGKSTLLRHTFPHARYIDLLEANRLQALEAGVEGGRFAALGLCTACRPDLCHSYRREGSSAGRMWLLAAMVGRVNHPSS